MVREPSVVVPTAAAPGARVALLASVTAPASVPVPLRVAVAATETADDESGPLTLSSPPVIAVAPAYVPPEASVSRPVPAFVKPPAPPLPTELANDTSLPLVLIVEVPEPKVVVLVEMSVVLTPE